MGRRKNGEGSYGEKTINGIKYKYYRSPNGKMLYAKTMKELNEKKDKYLNSAESKMINSQFTFYEYGRRWLKNKKGISPKTYEDYEFIIDEHIKPLSIGKRPVISLTPQMFEKYLDELADKYSRATIYKTWAVIRQIVKFGVGNKEIPENILLNIKLPTEDEVKSKKRKREFVDLDDMNAIYDECQKDVNHIAGQIIILIMYSGMRIAEAEYLKWGDVAKDFSQIHVHRSAQKIKVRDSHGQFVKDADGKYIYKYNEKTAKTSAGDRIVPLPKRGQEVLKEMYKREHTDDDYVFRTDDGKPFNHNMMTKPVKRIITNSKSVNKDYTLHALRRGYGSILLSKGVNIAVISKLLGHSKISTTLNIYTKAFDKDVEAAVRVFDE